MPKALDITNQKFGKLTALKKMPSQAGKTYWLCKCECGNEKIVQTGHLKTGAIQTCGNCPKENKKSQNVIAFRKRVKIALVQAFGGKCACCGLEDNPVIYDFHHLIPEEKEFGIANASTTRSRQAYADEAKKCVLLCANCHRKIENGLITNEDLTIIPFDEEVYYQTLEDLKS